MAEEKKPKVDNPDEDKNDSKDIEGGKKDVPPKKIKSDTDTEEDEEEAEDTDIEEKDVPVRKSTLQNVIARKNKTIEKLKSKAADDEDEDDETPPDEDDELTPEAESAIGRAVKKAVEPILGAVVSTADEDELKDLFSNEPEAKGFEKRIRAYMNHPSYKGVPPSVIFHHLAFGKAVAGGIKAKDTANLEAGHHRGGGRTLRPKDSGTGNIPSVEQQEDMTDEEFEKLQHDARTGKFVK